MNTLSVENLDQLLLVFCKLYILLYANDTVLLAESQENQQQSINLMERYCSMWKLNINVSSLVEKKEKYLNSFLEKMNLKSI